MSVYGEDVLVGGELVASVMAAVSGDDVFQPYVLGFGGQGEGGGQRFAGEDVGILLADVVDRIDDRFYMVGNFFSPLAIDIRLTADCLGSTKQEPDLSQRSPLEATVTLMLTLTLRW